MRIKHARKPRGMKQPRPGRPAERSYDLCPCCYAPGCDPFARHPKVERRLYDGLCPACGKPWDLCSCKSHKQGDMIQVHNNKHIQNYIVRRNKLIALGEFVHEMQQSDDSYQLLRAIKGLRTVQPDSVQRLQTQISHTQMPDDVRASLQTLSREHIQRSIRFLSRV